MRASDDLSDDYSSDDLKSSLMNSEIPCVPKVECLSVKKDSTFAHRVRLTYESNATGNVGCPPAITLRKKVDIQPKFSFSLCKKLSVKNAGAEYDGDYTLTDPHKHAVRRVYKKVGGSQTNEKTALYHFQDFKVSNPGSYRQVKGHYWYLTKEFKDEFVEDQVRFKKKVKKEFECKFSPNKSDACMEPRYKKNTEYQWSSTIESMNRLEPKVRCTEYLDKVPESAKRNSLSTCLINPTQWKEPTKKEIDEAKEYKKYYDNWEMPRAKSVAETLTNWSSGHGEFRGEDDSVLSEVQKKIQYLALGEKKIMDCVGTSEKYVITCDKTSGKFTVPPGNCAKAEEKLEANRAAQELEAKRAAQELENQKKAQKLESQKDGTSATILTSEFVEAETDATVTVATVTVVKAESEEKDEVADQLRIIKTEQHRLSTDL